jgi:NCAIR mutase (PurE)-related protein
MADFTFDFARQERIGLAETVFCQNKTTGQIAQAIELAPTRAAPLLFTRLADSAFDALPDDARAQLDYEPLSRTAILGPWTAPRGEPQAAIVTAGTSDLAVAREAVRTLAFYGIATKEFADVGVAGLWRILRHEQELKRFPVVIVVAGMEGALFSVVGGMVGGVVIAVPTSAGYGMARGGETALHAALCSCSPGLVVVNIDNGYGAACAAVRVLGAAAQGEARDRPSKAAE